MIGLPSSMGKKCHCPMQEFPKNQSVSSLKRSCFSSQGSEASKFERGVFDLVVLDALGNNLDLQIHQWPQHEHQKTTTNPA